MTLASRHGTAADRHRTRPAATRPARQSRIQLMSDGVVASYIHDISARTAPGSSSAAARGRGAGRAARRSHAHA